MKLLITLPLLLGGPTAIAAAEPVPGALRFAADDFDDLVEDFDAAVDNWKAELKAAEGIQARRDVRERHPARAFWSRFEASAQAGEGRSLLWMAMEVKNTGLKSSEVAEKKTRIYTTLVEKHVKASWFDDAVETIGRDKRTLGIEGVANLLGQVVEKAENADVRAHALYRSAKVLLGSKDAEQVALGEKQLIRASEAFASTRYGKLAADEAFVVLHLSPGKVAPDFDAKTIDGHEFKLSDYRGKVVLVDFYGFW